MSVNKNNFKMFFVRKIYKAPSKTIIIHQREGFKILFIENFNYLGTPY